MYLVLYCFNIKFTRERQKKTPKSVQQANKHCHTSLPSQGVRSFVGGLDNNKGTNWNLAHLPGFRL